MSGAHDAGCRFRTRDAQTEVFISCHVAYSFSGPPTSWLKGGARSSSIPGSRRQGAARRRSLGGSIEHPGLYAPVKERALENIFLKKNTGIEDVAAGTF